MNILVKLFERIIHMFDPNAFAAKVQQIATDHQAENAAGIATEVTKQLAADMQPVSDRMDVLEKALDDLTTALTEGDDAGAQVNATLAVVDAVPPAPAPAGGAAGS